MFTSPSDCPGCGVSPGQLHRSGCDVARCAATGQQRAGCCHPGSTCNTRWTGHWPGDAECWEYGFFIQPGPDASPNTPPLPDFERLYLECEWDPTQQRMIRRAPSAPPKPPKPPKPPTASTRQTVAYLKAASAHPQGHLACARVSSQLLRKLLQARYVYRNDLDGFVMDAEEALASSGDQPLIITLSGRRAALTTAQLAALTNDVGPDGRLAPSVPWPTTRALAAVGLAEFRDQQGGAQLYDGDNGVSGRRHHAFRTPLGQLVAELPEDDDRA